MDSQFSSKAISESQNTPFRSHFRLRKASQTLRFRFRYCRYESAKPLWPMSSGQPSKIPKCNYCGGPRGFEFRVQVVCHLQGHSLDDDES
ncbi:hypothetical protein ACSBR2_020559 [Camellia fascicularis]